MLPGDQVLLSYTPGTLQSTDGDAVAAVSNLVISTATINTFAIPGKLEAENFESNSGWTSETCTDDGGGYDMGYTDPGDYLDYRVEVAQAGQYRFDFRLSSGNPAGGKADLQLLTENGASTLISFTIPYTGGWQSWVTISKELTLPVGVQTLRMLVNKKEFNFNWMNSELLVATSTSNIAAQKPVFAIYPNPARQQLHIEYEASGRTPVQFHIRNLLGEVLRRSILNENTKEIDISNLKNGLYFFQLTDEGHIYSQAFVVLN